MMQVQEINNAGLKREFSIKIPHGDMEKALVKRLGEIGKKAKIQGFRPGKAPLSIIRQRFGHDTRHEVLDKTVTECTQKILRDNALRPAMQPQVELINGAEGQDLEFKLIVEILPEITPMDFGKLSFDRPVADVAPQAVDDVITRVSKSLREPELVTEKRAAKMGDVLVIDFDGTVDGTPFPGMKAEDHKIELGSHSFIDTFEEQLVGLKTESKKNIKVKFPADYHAKHLAGKTAIFAVAVKELRVHKPVEMNDELAKEAGFPSLDALRKHITDDTSADYAKISRSVLKRKLMDKLADAHDFSIPAGLADAEFAAIWQQVEKDKAAGSLPADEAKKSDDDLRAEYRQIAERRVRLGLLLADVAQKNKIEVKQGDLRNAMIAEARRFPGQEKAVIDYYTKTEGAVERLRAPLLEEKVVDFILAQAKITDKKITADELMKLPEEE
jgi:trigger factor